MSEKYTPQVGDIIRREGWSSRESSMTVVASTDDYLWLIGDDDKQPETHWRRPWDWAGEWVKVEPVVPLPERWRNIYDDGADTLAHRSRAKADSRASDGRIAVIHWWTDDDGDHCEIERVDQ
jgi:hypothetical protein